MPVVRGTIESKIQSFDETIRESAESRHSSDVLSQTYTIRINTTRLIEVDCLRNFRHDCSSKTVMRSNIELKFILDESDEKRNRKDKVMIKLFNRKALSVFFEHDVAPSSMTISHFNLLKRRLV